MSELAELLAHDVPDSVRHAAISALRNIILTLELDQNGVPGTVRKVRRLTLDVLKTATAGDLSFCFKDGELEDLDLFAMNFSGARLAGISFERCFLVEANCRRSNLAGSSFAGAFVRNVDFSEADLSGADLTDIDWFNALGLTANQLERVQMETLGVCPPDVGAMHRVLDARYGFPFDSWSTQVQGQLRTTWADYLQPGGLKDIIAGWKRA